LGRKGEETKRRGKWRKRQGPQGQQEVLDAPAVESLPGGIGKTVLNAVRPSTSSVQNVELTDAIFTTTSTVLRVEPRLEPRLEIKESLWKEL